MVERRRFGSRDVGCVGSLKCGASCAFGEGAFSGTLEVVGRVGSLEGSANYE